MKTFLLKAKQFFKRHIYPITVSVCTVLVLGLVTVSAYSSIKNGSEVVVDTNVPPADVDASTNVGDQPSKEEVKEPAKEETIIFELPFLNATISKEYTDSSLLYDATTKLWCTHQGMDFACNEGQEVKAVYDGKIVKIENSMMNGTVVHLKINDKLTVVYKGLSSNVKVKEGDTVKKGSIIGVVTGFLTEKADGVHLHLEVFKEGKLVDPTEYFSFSK